MQLKHREKLVYVLPFIGDFNNSMLGVLIVLYGVKLALTPVQIGWITSFYGFGYLIFPFFFGKIIDRISRKKSLLIATISITGISAVYIGLIAIGSGPSANIFFIGMIIGQFLRAAGYSFYWPTIEAYLSENSEHSEEAHKKSIARFCMAWAFGSAVGSGLAGIFAEISVLLGFCIVVLIYMCAIIIAWKVIPYSSSKSAHHKQIQQVPIQQSQIQQVPIQQASIQQSSPQQTSTKQKSVNQISAKNILNQPEKNQKNYRFWIS
ncbi:MAG: MFS transporter, partial [Promethearchaeota archaeon]